jgi:hypothetical protein
VEGSGESLSLGRETGFPPFSRMYADAPVPSQASPETSGVPPEGAGTPCAGDCS